MANANPPVKNQAFQIHVCLKDAANPGRFKTNPTLASGDFKISKDGGAFANLASLPTVTPASGVGVMVAMTSTEMNADNILIVASDQTEPPEWDAWELSINTTA